MASASKQNKRKFLLGFFKQENQNETLELNGFILFKHWDGNNGFWTVDIFTKENYQNMILSKKSQPQKETLF